MLRIDGGLLFTLHLLLFTIAYNDMIEEVRYNPIGIIHTPFKTTQGMPVQASRAKGIKGKIEIKPEYVEGLEDLDGFSHIILLFHFHLSQGYSLKVIPFFDDQLRGVFATRAPKRPNSIGLSIVALKKVSANILEVEDVDMLDGTPLLDIKPYTPEFDTRDNVKCGWLANAKSKKVKSDKRFI